MKNITVKKLKKQKFSLILSGGSTKGIAHIGIIKWLEENDLVPDEIIGSSIGSIIGALYSLGKSHLEIIEMVHSIDGLNLFDFSYTKGKIEHKKINKLFKKIFKKIKISETKIKLKIVATKLVNGDPKVFSNKDSVFLIDAVMASISIPGIFNIKKIKNKKYIDGGVSSNLPVEFAKKNNIKIVSNIVNHDYKTHIKNKHGLFSNITKNISVIKSSIYYLLRSQTYSKILYIKKIILIEPPVHEFSSYKLNNYKKMVRIGYNEAKKYIKN